MDRCLVRGDCGAGWSVRMTSRRREIEVSSAMLTFGEEAWVSGGCMWFRGSRLEQAAGD